MGNTLVLGVGNPLMGDDGIGVLAVQRLQAQPNLPPNVDVLDGGTAGLGLIPVIETYRRVLLVDAVPMGLPPGTVRRFTWAEVRLANSQQPLSLHQSDMTSALLLAEALGSLPEELVIFGVQPQNMDWDQPLSDAVANTLPELVNSLLAEL